MAPEALAAEGELSRLPSAAAAAAAAAVLARLRELLELRLAEEPLLLMLAAERLLARFLPSCGSVPEIGLAPATRPRLGAWDAAAAAAAAAPNGERPKPVPRSTVPKLGDSEKVPGVPRPTIGESVGSSSARRGVERRGVGLGGSSSTSVSLSSSSARPSVPNVAVVELELELELVSAPESAAEAPMPAVPLATLRLSVEFQWFLMALSVRPGK